MVNFMALHVTYSFYSLVKVRIYCIENTKPMEHKPKWAKINIIPIKYVEPMFGTKQSHVVCLKSYEYIECFMK